jgi:cation:H+ antiporter
MPELVVSTFSALEGHSDLAMGNVVGSNLSNLLFILGICAVIKPLVFNKQTKFIDNFIAIFATILLFIFSIDNNINRTEGIILMLGCISLIIYNIVMTIKNKQQNSEVEEIETRMYEILKKRNIELKM